VTFLLDTLAESETLAELDRFAALAEGHR
jgi:hypothetical protein